MRNIYINSSENQPLELTFDEAYDDIVLGLNLSKVSTAVGGYTAAQADAKFRQISDSFSITETYNRAEVDAKVGSIKSFYSITQMQQLLTIGATLGM